MTDKMVNKRSILVFCMFLLLAVVTIVQLLTLTLQPEYVRAAAGQSTFRIEVDRSRGRIYDCKMRSLAGGRIEYRAVIEPSPQTIEHLSGVLHPEEISEISNKLTGRSPFVYAAHNASIAGEGVTVYRGEKRYGHNSAAKHVVGYINGSGEGIYGIEKAYNEYLEQCAGHITAVYTVDSLGRNLSGIEPVVTDTTDISKGGVILTIDLDLQQIAEAAAEKYMEKGAVVLMEIPSGKIRACVSNPTFDQENIAKCLKDENSPLVNRALAAYDIGSVFKLVVAAAALENGIDESWKCECRGSIQIGDNIFHCSNKTGHGEIGMCQAISGSCNIYFIELARSIGADAIMEYAERLGFGEKLMLAENYFSASGCMPEAQSLKNPAALANFAFGQGELMATPIHIAQLVGAVANNGVMPKASLFESYVTPTGEKFAPWEYGENTQTIAPNTALLLQEFMAETVLNGTGKAGYSEYVASAAKTGTAQTGIFENGRNILQAWYAGFFPLDDPQYVCVAVVEDGESGGATAGPVFKYIADKLYG